MISIIASMMMLLAAIAVWKIAKPMKLSNTTINSFMSLMTMRAAQEIQVDPTIKR